MCGILAILGSNEHAVELKAKALKLSKRLRHRGPDWNGIYIHQFKSTVNVLAHERLAIVDLENGAQPLSDETRRVHLCVNGEIYNHRQLRHDTETGNGYKFMTKSDCECIIPLYLKHGSGFVDMLDGIFAFILYDSQTGSYLAARDPIGVCSMYIGWHHDGSTWFASEMKALEDCTLVEEFPPGHHWSNDVGRFTRWYNPIWLDESYLPTQVVDYELLRSKLITSVVKRMMTDVPFGVLLSGGLDSSIIAAIAARHRKETQQTDYGYASENLLTFSIGLENAPDLAWAKQVAEFIGTKHYSFTYTIEEGIEALHDVIHHIETYDVTTVRSSTPMFLMARRIKAMGIKVVLSGEGSDEIFGGYLYFHKAPSAEEFHKELVRKVTVLSKFDCLRANKSTAAWGVETRVPFLDRQFLDTALNIDARYKMVRQQQQVDAAGGGDAEQRMEKYILRKAFDDPDKPYLPPDVLWRQKEQFSDGVGYGWIDGLREHANKTISDQQFAMAPVIYAYNTPATKEAYLYRTIFDSIFKKESCARTVPSGASIACSTEAALKWDPSWSGIADPSGRAVRDVHRQAQSIMQDA
jgi:asparagine synthase (glutamine-hydrolysing)